MGFNSAKECHRPCDCIKVLLFTPKKVTKAFVLRTSQPNHQIP